MNTEQLIILKKELNLLKTHLMRSSLSDFNKQKLLAELRTARLVNTEELPTDVVCLNSTVEIMDIDNKQKFTFQLVLPSEANMKISKVSVFAPIGVALLGYRIGADVQWEMPSGIKIFRILKVVQNAEESETDNVSDVKVLDLDWKKAEQMLQEMSLVFNRNNIRKITYNKEILPLSVKFASGDRSEKLYHSISSLHKQLLYTQELEKSE